MRYFCFLFCFFLLGCSNSLPSYERELSAFIPHEKVIEEAEFDDFADENFPDNCVWFDLASVVDGDTVKLVDGSSVRFVGIDTPETVHPSKPIQYCGPESSVWTKKVFENNEKVCLIFDSLSDERDKYDRRLAYPFTEEGVDVTAELLRLGLARGYFYFPFSRKDEFRFYHDVAKKEKVGVWGHQNCLQTSVFF